MNWMNWAFPLALVLIIVVPIAIRAALEMRRRKRRMEAALVDDCGLCGSEIEHANAVCDTCDWNPELRHAPELRSKYEAYRALRRAIEESNAADLQHSRAREIGMLPGGGARAHAADAADQGFRAEMDAMNAVDQALLAAPELRARVAGLSDAFEIASRLIPELRAELLAACRAR